MNIKVNTLYSTRKIFFFIIGVVLWVTIAILSYRNTGGWLFDIISYSIPILLILQICIIIYLGFRNAKLLACILILGGFICAKPVRETVAMGTPCIDSGDSSKSLKVFSFNASTFNSKRNYVYAKPDSSFIDDLCNYLGKQENQPDVLCFQEFHHDDWEKKRVIEELVSICKTKYYYMLPFWRDYQNGFFGLIILSKYPIVEKGVLFNDGSQSFNKGIYANIKYGDDTIKIVNLHLQSMSIRLMDSTSVGVKDKAISVFNKLKSGSEKRKLQMDTVENTIKSSKYPIILCGDLNSFPYGYSYQKIKNYLKNSFEESGSGFGFTLNIAPYYVRLDNQFCSNSFRPVKAQVVREINKSDHFPLFCRYLFCAD